MKIANDLVEESEFIFKSGEEEMLGHYNAISSARLHVGKVMKLLLLTWDELVDQFVDDRNNFKSGEEEILEHYNAISSAQLHVWKDMKLLLLTWDELGNQFIDDSNDFYALVTKVVANQTLASNFFRVESIGQKQCRSFLHSRM